RARIAVRAFDKLDAEKGMEVRAPKGELRWIKNPWSVMAFQIAGADGLRLLHPEEKDEERNSAPAENLMTELLALPQKEDLSTLVLIDEVLMYAREGWQRSGVAGPPAGFLPVSHPAATKVERSAVIASLLATDPRKSDTLGSRSPATSTISFAVNAIPGPPPRVGLARASSATSAAMPITSSR